MLLILLGRAIDLRELQLANTEVPIVVTLSGIFIEERDEQPSNAELSIVCKAVPNTIDWSDEQLRNVEFSIRITLLGILIDCRDEHPSNAFSPIVETDDGITILLIVFEFAKPLEEILTILYTSPIYEIDSGMTISPMISLPIDTDTSLLEESNMLNLRLSTTNVLAQADSRVKANKIISRVL